MEHQVLELRYQVGIEHSRLLVGQGLVLAHAVAEDTVAGMEQIGVFTDDFLVFQDDPQAADILVVLEWLVPL